MNVHVSSCVMSLIHNKDIDLISIFIFIAVVEIFSITKLVSTAVIAEWSSVTGASHYTVYYESTSSSSRKKRQVDTGMRVFPGDTTEGLIGGLDPNLNYLFSISTSFNINGIIYEGERTQPMHASGLYNYNYVIIDYCSHLSS